MKHKILKIIILIIVIILVILSLLFFFNYNKYEKVSYHKNGTFSTDQFVNGKYLIIDNYNLYTEVKFNMSLQCESQSLLSKFSKFNKSFFTKNNLLAIICDGSTNLKSNIESFTINDNTIDVAMYVDTHGITSFNLLDLYFISIPKNIENVNLKYNYEKHSDLMSYKPIIYLYPKKDTSVSIKLKYNNNITVSYPKYETGWNVLARPDGMLTDLTTNKNLYSLYYESKNAIDFKVEKDGFIVEEKNIASFLEEKLAILGLNERESEEFIIYWLPILQENKYNYIRFATQEEINQNMPLFITPNPDTIIRVLMTYKKLEYPIEVKEQQLLTPERNGFVAVEWGGTEL